MEKTSCKSGKSAAVQEIPDSGSNDEGLSEDYSAIELLHRMDQAAVSARNTGMLVNLYTEDCVMLPPATEPLYGRDAVREYLDDKFREWGNYDIARFDQQFLEVFITGNMAYEWGICKGVFYMKNGSPEIFENSRLFRILSAQPDGSWKIARVIWHDVP